MDELPPVGKQAHRRGSQNQRIRPDEREVRVVITSDRFARWAAAVGILIALAALLVAGGDLYLRRAEDQALKPKLRTEIMSGTTPSGCPEVEIALTNIGPSMLTVGVPALYWEAKNTAVERPFPFGAVVTRLSAVSSDPGLPPAVPNPIPIAPGAVARFVGKMVVLENAYNGWGTARCPRKRGNSTHSRR